LAASNRKDSDMGHYTKDCPKCGFVIPNDAVRCDCGYDFQKPQISEPQSPQLTGIGCALLIFSIGIVLGCVWAAMHLWGPFDPGGRMTLRKLLGTLLISYGLPGIIAGYAFFMGGSWVLKKYNMAISKESQTKKP